MGPLSYQVALPRSKLVEVVGLEPTMMPACKAGAVAAVPYPHKLADPRGIEPRTAA